MTITLIFVFILRLSMEEDYTTQLVAQTYNLISVSHRIFWRLWWLKSNPKRGVGAGCSPVRQFCIYLIEMHQSGEFGAFKK